MTNDLVFHDLIENLTKLVDLMRLDPNCQWLPKFESDLAVCSRLKDRGYTPDDLYALSNSVTYVFQGMGSFNDYEPGIYNKSTGRFEPIDGTEEFEQIKTKVYDLARRLCETPA
jgi:hypothetical protein